MSLFAWSGTSVEKAKGMLKEQSCSRLCCPGELGSGMFNLGVIRNLRRFLGKWTFIWIMPILLYTKSGFEYGCRPYPNPTNIPKNKIVFNKPLDPERYKERINAKVGNNLLYYEDVARINNIMINQ